MDGESSDNITLANCFICYICGDFFKRPRILPCGHTFCSECLGKLRDEIVNDGKHDQEQMPNAGIVHSSYENGIGNKPIVYPENTVKNGSAVCEPSVPSNGVTTKNNSRDERKPSSSCVDDVDFISTHSLPSSATSSYVRFDGMSMSSSATYTCLRDTDKCLQRQITRSSSPRNRQESKSPSERTPSMVTSTSLAKSRHCSHCGNAVTPQRNSSASPIKRSTSMTSTREKSPTNLRDLPKWDNSSPHRRSTSHLHPPACSFEHKHGREMEPFVCPFPQCTYSMRVMNLARWSPKNRALASALSAWQRQQTNMKDGSSQTDISNSQSVLVTIPRHFVVDSSASSSLMPLPRRKRHSSMIDIAIDQAVSLDGPLQYPGYLPRGHYTWKSYAAMVGMNILQQVLNL